VLYKPAEAREPQKVKQRECAQRSGGVKGVLTDPIMLLWTPKARQENRSNFMTATLRPFSLSFFFGGGLKQKNEG
jgi:hypothetical protein